MYVAQGGVIDWFAEAWKGRSAPPSVIRIPASTFVEQEAAVMAAIGSKRGWRDGKTVQTRSGKTFHMYAVPRATCSDVKDVWSKYGRALVGGVIDKTCNQAGRGKADCIRGTYTGPAIFNRNMLAVMYELRAVGNGIDPCGFALDREYARNDYFWPALREAALQASSLLARPEPWELWLESWNEAAEEAKQGAEKLVEPLARWSIQNLAPWLIGGAIVYFAIKD